MSRPRILVTGASGRVGSAVVMRLLDAGHPVTTLTRGPRQAQPGERAVEGDVRDADAVRAALDGVDAVAHLAAIPRPTGAPAPEIFGNNVTATFSLLWTAAEMGVRHFVIASSINALGLHFNPHRPLPLRYPIDEATAADIADPYSLSKQTDEQTLRAVCRRFEASGVALRLPLVVPAEDALELRRWAASLEAEGAAEAWSWLDLEDAAEAFALALGIKTSGVHVLGLAAPTTFSDVPTAELLARHAPEVPVHGAFPGHAAPIDTRRAQALLGFVPRHTAVEVAAG